MPADSKSRRVLSASIAALLVAVVAGRPASAQLVVDGATVDLNSASSYNGSTLLRNGGVLNANVAGALPVLTRSDFFFDQSGSGGSVLTLGADQVVASLSGASSSRLLLGGFTLTAGKEIGSSDFAGVISGTGGLTKEGASVQILSGANTYSGLTTVQGVYSVFGQSNGSAIITDTSRGNFGTLRLTGSLANTSGISISGGGTFINGSANQANNDLVVDRINSAATLSMGGGTFTMASPSGASMHSQSLASLSVGAGFNLINSEAATGSARLSFTGSGSSVYSRTTGGMVNFALSTGLGVAFTNAPTAHVSGGGADAILVGAFLNGSDFIAAKAGDLAAASYVTSLGAGKNANVTSDLATSGSASVNSVRFNDATKRTVTVGASDVLTIASGGIIAGGSAPKGAATSLSGITGGSLTSGTHELVFSVQNNQYIRNGFGLHVGSRIVDNAGTPLCLNITGNAAVLLSNQSNSFTGNIYLNGGQLALGGAGGGEVTDGVLGGANTIYATSGANTIRADFGANAWSVNHGISIARGAAFDLVTQSGLPLTVNASITGAGVFSTGLGTYNQGNGVVIPASQSGFTGTYFIGSFLRANEGVGLSSSANLTLAMNSTYLKCGVLETSANMVRSLGAGAGQVQFGQSNSNSFGGGFSAVGAAGGNPVTVSLGGVGTPQALTWGVGGFMPAVHGFDDFRDSGLVLQNGNANNTITWANPINNNWFNISVTQGAANASAATAATMTGVISGAGGLLKTGDGLLVLSAANTYSGNTKVGVGTLALGNNLALQNSAIDTSGAGVFALSTGVTAPVLGGLIGSKNLSSVITGNYSTLTALTLNAGAGVTNTYSGIIANGAAGMTLNKTGEGTQVLSGVNTYTGATTVSQGTLIIGALYGVSGNYTVSSGATLNFTATITHNNIFNGNGTVRFSVNPSDRIGFVNFQMGSGGLIWFDSNLSRVAGSNSWGGNWNNNLASLRVDSGTFLDFVEAGNSRIAQFDALLGSGTVGGGYGSASTLTVGAANGSGTFSGTIKNGDLGPLALSKSGTGTQVLSGNNTYTGGTVVNGGTLLLSGSLASNSPITVNSGGTFTNGRGDIWGDSNTTTVGPAFTINGGTLASGNGFFLPITGGVTLNNGTILLNGGANSTYPSFGLQGTMTVYGNSSVTVGGGSNNGIRIGGAITDTLTVNTVNASDTLTWNGVVSGDRLAKSGGGTLTLTGANTYAGATAINAGTLAVAPTGRLGNGDYSGAITNNGAFLYSGTNNQILRGVISGSGSLTHSGSGTLTLSGINTYTGGTVVNGGTLLLTGSLALNSPITVNSGGTFTNGRGDIWGNSDTTTVGPAFAINGGTLASGNGFFLPITGGVTLNNGTILLNGGANVTFPSFGLQGTMTVYGNSSVTVGAGSNNGIRIGGAITDTLTVNTVNAADTLTWNGVVSGDRLAKSGGGTLTLTGANTYTGATAINAGTLAIASTGRLGNGDYFGNITNAGAFIYSGTNEQILRGVVSGSGSLTHSGLGALTLFGTNTYTGATRVDLGELRLGNGGSLGATDVMVGSGLTPTATAGHATFAVFGNSTLGTGTGGTLTITGGNTGGSPVGQGTLSLQDGTLNTLTLANTTDGATNLVLGGTVGNAALLRLDVGASGVDLIAAGQRLTLNPGGAVVNLNALAGPALGLGTYDFLTYASDSALQGTLSFAGGLTTVPWGGGRSLTLQTTPTAARLVVAAVNAPANAYWTGSQSAVWAALDGSNQTNWVDAPAGVNTQQLPGLTTNVFFTANSAGNLNTTLGQDFAVNSLNFTAGAGAAVISGNTLTLFGTGSNGNTAGNGISVAAGSGAHTIASDVVVGGDQTWTNGSVNALTVSGSLGGAAGIGLNGAFVFSGTAGNTFTGTLTVGSGSLTLSKTAGVDAVAGGLVVTGGTVNWSAANQMNDTSAVTVNGGSLALGGFDETVGAVSLVDGAITGSGVLNGSGFAVQSGTVSARLGGPGAALTKTGPGTVTLNTAAVYTGATEVRDGTLLLNGVGLGATAVTLGSGAATTGTLRVAGDVTLGTATGGSLTILGGTGGGVLSLEDGAINTLTLANGGATLTAGGAPGQDARVTLELSNTTTDRITVAGRMALNAGGLTLGLSQLAGTSLENGTYDLMRFAAGPGAGAPVGFAGGLSSIPVGGGRSFTLQTTAEAVQLLVRSVAYPGALFWSGAQNGNWSSLGSSNETNWVDGLTGTNTQQIPGPTSNVYFTAVGALNSGGSVLGMDLAINSLNFNATASGPVGISGHTLALYATNANGNVAGSGLTVESGSGAHTISSALILGGDQGWWNYSSNPLTVSGAIQGSNTLGLTGKFTWSGAAANTLSGRTTLQTGTLALAKNAGVNAVAGDLLVNGGTVQWRASEQIADTSHVTVDGGALALGAHNETVAELILRSGTITGDGALVAGSYTVESGSIRAALAGPGASFLKTGAGTAVLSGANTFAGGARLEGGTVHVEVSNTGAVSGAFGPSIQSISVHPVQNDAALLLNGAHTLANPIAVFAGGGAGVTLGGSHTSGAGVFSGDIALGRDAVLASAGGDVEFRGALSGMGGATVRATTGRVLFAGSAANTHTGLTTLESGTLVLAKTGGAWAVPGDVTINGGRLEFAGNHQIVDTATVRVNAGTVDVRGFTDTVKDLVITGGTVTGGALRISAVVDARAGVLDVGLAGAVPLDKTTGGVTELRGSSPNTFSGLTSVAAGTLLLNKDNGVTAITGDGRADVVVPDVVIRGGSLRSAANGQLDPTVTLLMTSGGLDLNGKTETIFDFTNSGGVFRTGAGGKLTVTSLNTTTWSGGSNTVNTGGSLTTPHLVIRGGLNVVETGGVLNVGNGAAAGGELEFSNGGSLVLQSGTAAPGRLVLSDDVTVSGLGGSLVTSGTGTKPGVVDLGGTRLITVSDAADFSVTASLDNGALRKAGAGTLTLSGANTHAGGTVIDAGAVVLGHARGFGAGDVRLNDAILRMSGEPLQARIGGNYFQGAGGSLQLRVSRGGGGALQSDRLLVAGRAELGGTLQLTSTGRVQMRLGERVTLLEAEGGLTGAFSEIRNGLATSTIVRPTVTLENQAVVLEGELGSFSGYAQTMGLTLNQRATAAALDRVALDSRETRLIGALSELPLETLPSTLDRIAPEELSAVYQQAVASARAQSWNLQQRLREARSGWRGFSSAGLRSRDGRGEAKAVPGGAVLGGAAVANLSARLSDLAVNQTREAADAGKAWTFFINGELEWVDIDSTANARGYDLQSSGVSVGADFLASENLVLGLTTGYSRGDAELAGGGRLKMEGGSQFGAYAGYFKDGFHADGIVGGGMSAYEIRRAGFGGNARGDTDGREFHMELSGGKDWRVGRITFGPEVSLRYAWAGLEGYTERGSLAPLRIESQDVHSLQFEVGGHAAYAWKVGSLVVTPEARMFWQHETLEDSPWVASRFASGAGGVFRVRGPRLGRDSLVGSGSVTVQMGEKWSGYAAYTGEFLRVNSATHRVNVGLRMEF